VRHRRPLEAAAVAAAAFGLTVLLQARGGVYGSEFSAHPDESAHYVTALMVREYVAAGAPQPPVPFAQDYYVHYPKVAIGHWPPLFYGVQAAWTLLFSPSRVSLLLLMASLTAALALTLYLALREEVGRLIGLLAALLLPALPLVQKASGMVMAEIPLALFSLWAALALGRFLDSGRTHDAVRFALAAAAAIMTKGNGFALALVVPLALALSARWRLLARPALWSAGALVAVLCGPWYVLTARMVRHTFLGGSTLVDSAPTGDHLLSALAVYVPALLVAGGVGLVPFLALGLVERVGRPWARGGVPGKWAAAAALVIATLAFHCLIRSGREPRHMVMGLPAMMMLVAAGVEAAVRWAGRAEAARWRLAAAALAVVAFAATGFSVPAKVWSGFGAVAERLIAFSGDNRSVFLVVSDARGEGMFITEVARREPRPRRILLRSSKVLYRSGWNGENYRPLHRSAAELLAFLDKGVQVVVLDHSSDEAALEHHRLFAQTILAQPGRWESLGRWPVHRSGRVFEGALEAYRYRPARASELELVFKDLIGP
jgi:4-amino-4-deoxy-L-arabinose transferase-like glycosyltransferase